jgi:hypothetical protein
MYWVENIVIEYMDQNKFTCWKILLDNIFNKECWMEIIVGMYVKNWSTSIDVGEHS